MASNKRTFGSPRSSQNHEFLENRNLELQAFTSKGKIQPHQNRRIARSYSQYSFLTHSIVKSHFELAWGDKYGGCCLIGLVQQPLQRKAVRLRPVLMQHCCKQARGNGYILEVALCFFRRLTRLEPAAFAVFDAVSLTARYYLTCFGSPRMGCDSGRTIPPRMFTAEPVRRLIGDSAESVHAPPYIRVGRENGVVGRVTDCMSGLAF